MAGREQCDAKHGRDHFGAAVVHVVLGREDGDARRFEPHLEILGRGTANSLTAIFT